MNASHDPGPPSTKFGEDLSPISSQEWNKRAQIFTLALEQAQEDRGSLRDPRERLRVKWQELRIRLKSQVSASARAEYERLTAAERADRHATNTWKHPEARLLYANLLQLKTRASEAGAIVDEWFRRPEFDVTVQSFRAGRITAADLLAQARRLQKADQ